MVASAEKDPQRAQDTTGDGRISAASSARK
jgi:hypothetical protein